jgi:hypothetical protein
MKFPYIVKIFMHKIIMRYDKKKEPKAGDVACGRMLT